MTNMVYIDIGGLGWNGDDFREACEKLGWKSRGSATSLRLCTNYGIEREDIEAFLEGISAVVQEV